MAAETASSIIDSPEAVFQEYMVQLIRTLALHRPDETPCGQPVSVGEAHALLEIARQPGMTQNGLATRLRLEKSTVSRVVGMLERRGWIRRERDERDTRFIRLHLTRRGISANIKIADSRRVKSDRLFGALPAGHRATIVKSLALLLEAARDQTK